MAGGEYCNTLPMRPPRMFLFAIVVLAFTASGCATAPDRSDALQVVTADKSPDATREAAIEGVVESSSECFILLSDDETRWLVEWPHGSRLGDDGQSVEVQGFGTVHLGDRLVGSGGYGENTEGCSSPDIVGTVSIDVLTSTTSGHTGQG